MKALLEKTSVSKQKRLSPRSVVVLFFAVLVAALLVACAPRQNTEIANSSEEIPVAEVDSTFTYTSASDCLMCHSQESGALSLVNCEAIEASATQEGCVICHNDESGLVQGHEGVSMTDTDKEARIFDSKITDDTCLNCHNQDEIIAATSGSTALTDANGLTVSPHTLMVEHNEAGQHNATTCSSCHKMHADKPLESTAKDYCLSCHHQNEFECYTCHED